MRTAILAVAIAAVLAWTALPASAASGRRGRSIGHGTHGSVQIHRGPVVRHSYHGHHGYHGYHSYHPRVYVAPSYHHGYGHYPYHGYRSYRSYGYGSHGGVMINGARMSIGIGW